jgi:hypothetical protein
MTERLPQWWSSDIEAAWSRSREAALDDLRARGDRRLPTDPSIVEHALAFGHGARSAYSHLVTWETIEPRLRADWTELGNVGPAAWDVVAAIIRHEWLRAAGASGDAAPADAPPRHA